MSPPRHRDRETSRRKASRSLSPSVHKHKRSWQSSSIPDRSYSRSSPPRKKQDKSPPRFRQSSTAGYSRKSRSRSPKYSKRNVGNVEGLRYPSSKGNFKSRSPVGGVKPEFGSRLLPRSRKRSLSPRNSSRNEFDDYRAQTIEDRKPKNMSRSPDSTRHHGLSAKKKARQLSPPLLPPVGKKLSHGRSPSPLPPPSKKPDSSQRHPEREGSIVQRKVSTESKKKASRMTLHHRFTTDDTEPYKLNVRDNVTIAILRNPHAEPSEDTTVQRVFDSSLFKMIHKKTEGRKPIFDREEIKLWGHDENIDDDPDFEERRLVRVKSVPKKAVGDNRMSPDVLRKPLGVDLGHRSGSRSPHQSPNVRLNPKPDSRYESRYRQQVIREDTTDRPKKRKEEERRGTGRRADEGEDRFQGRGEERADRENRYSKGSNVNDLRQALDRRRSGRDEDYDRDGGHYYSDSRRHQEDDRNVVVDKGRDQFDDLDEEDRGRRREGWRGGGEKRRAWVRGRGRGPRRQWSPRRNNYEGREGQEVRDRGYEKRERFSASPVHFKGRGGGGYRGRPRQLSPQYEEEDRNAIPSDDYYKYAQHDDRDVSPKSFRGRGRGMSFRSRGFRGSRGFRAGRRGRGFQASGRGRGFYRPDDSRSVEKDDRRSVEHSSDREWKHDMYESVQSDEEELPHSTT